MSTLITIFAVCFLGGMAMLLLKSVEINRGHRIVFREFRNLIDALVLRTPSFVSRQRGLFLARLSLYAHSMSALMHRGAGEVRRFFRQRAIKFMSSAHHQSVTNGEHHGVSYYLRRLAERHNTISRE